MKITIVDNTSDKESADFGKLFRLPAKKITKKLQLPAELQCAVVLVNDRQMQDFNRAYRKIDKPTDVISFALKDASDNYETNAEIESELGDIFINVDAAKRQALSYGHSFIRETRFLFIHGLLHLLGYNHIEANDEEEMCALQREILNEMDG